ncbi:cytochrome oxidase complex assembly protein 1-domain-containing protein [Dipodascopsis uninucleata]
MIGIRAADILLKRTCLNGQFRGLHTGKLPLSLLEQPWRIRCTRITVEARSYLLQVRSYSDGVKSTPVSQSAPSPFSPVAKQSEKPKFNITVDRELPAVGSTRGRLILYYAIFFSVVGVAAVLFLNYERQQSAIVSSTLYSIRRSNAVKELLGSNIRFRDSFPWISGDSDFLHGHVDMSYVVIGSKNIAATVRFKSIRPVRREPYQVVIWEVVTEDGTRLDLLGESDTPVLEHSEDALIGKK